MNLVTMQKVRAIAMANNPKQAEGSPRTRLIIALIMGGFILFCVLYNQFVLQDEADKAASRNAAAESTEQVQQDNPQQNYQTGHDAAPSTNSSQQKQQPSDMTITNQDKQQAKQVAIKFAKNWYQFDASKPMQHVKAIKPYATDTFYQFYKKNPPRGTLQREKADPNKVDVYPVEDAPENKIVWNVIVIGEATTNKGKTYQEEIWYFIKLGQHDGSWKVEGMRVQ